MFKAKNFTVYQAKDSVEILSCGRGTIELDKKKLTIEDKKLMLNKNPIPLIILEDGKSKIVLYKVDILDDLKTVEDIDKAKTFTIIFSRCYINKFTTYE